MREVTALDDRLNRLTNRLMRRFPQPSLAISTREPIVSFTFDDVPDTALSNGARILEAHQARGTFYIAGGLVDRVEAGRTLISENGIGQLHRRGHEIACHTFAHRNVRKTSAGVLRADLDRNRDFLQQATGGWTPRNFAFPYNAMSPFAREEFTRRFRTTRGGGERINRGVIDPRLLGAVEIRQPAEHAAGLTRWVDDVVENPGWLIFFVHDIADVPTPHGTTPAIFDHLVRHAVERGCTLLTVDAALDRLEAGRVH